VSSSYPFREAADRVRGHVGEPSATERGRTPTSDFTGVADYLRDSRRAALIP